MRIPRRVPPAVPHVDMTGRLCVVTGGSSGIGLETARALAQRGAAVTVVGRTPARVEAATETLKTITTSGEVAGLTCDFASLEEVSKLAKQLLAMHKRIDVLVNNAGVWNKDRKETTDGHEHTFAVNHLAPFSLTMQLMDALLRGKRTRIVNVSSRLHRKARRFDFDDVHQRNRRFSGLRAYQQSKLANVLFTRELALRTRDLLNVNAVHPGDVATDVVRDSALLAWGSRNIGKLWLLTPEEGARTSVHVATATELDNVSGHYFASCKQRAPSPAAHDRDQARKLWQLSEKLTGQTNALGQQHSF